MLWAGWRRKRAGLRIFRDGFETRGEVVEVRPDPAVRVFPSDASGRFHVGTSVVGVEGTATSDAADRNVAQGMAGSLHDASATRSAKRHDDRLRRLLRHR